MDKKIFKINYFLNSNDAVAEVLDFVSILGILMLSFSLLALSGYPVLKSAQETRYVENTRLSFIVLAENMNKIALGQAPSKSIELKLYGGRLSTTGESAIMINATVFNSSKPGNENVSFSSELRSIENSVGDTVVAYENTGVWIEYPNDVVLNAYKPLIINQSGSLVIPVARITGNSSVGGNGMSRIKAEGEPKETVWSNASNITVNITGNYVAGWKGYFEKIDEMNWIIVSYTSGSLNVKLNATQNIDVYIINTNLYTEIES